MNFDGYKSVGTHWIPSYVIGYNLTYFELNIFRKKLRNSEATKILQENIYAIQTNDLILCGYFCIGFINLKNMKRMIKNTETISIT